MRNIGMACIQLTDREVDAAVAVLKSGALRQGKQCDTFELEFAEKTGARFGVTAANGSATLHLAHMAYISPGDEVLVPSFTFIATGSMIDAAGGVPVFVDVDPQTFLIDLNDAERKITPKTKGISPVHLFGNTPDIHAVQTLAQKHGLTIVWDAAQAHGATFEGNDIGSYGDFVSYSFYPSKNMFVGEGGITLTNNEEYAHKMRFMRSHGQTGKYLHTMKGLNYRMTDVEAAIGREQLKRLDEMLVVRRRNAEMLNSALADIAGINPQRVTKGCNHAWHQYCVTVDPETAGFTRDVLQARLKERGVATGVHYPRGMHQQPVFIERYGKTTLPVCERLCETILALPVHHGLSEEDMLYVIEAIRDSTK